MRKTPSVSVILTTRDRPNFLRLALQCFEHQTYYEKELIVVDDGVRFPVDSKAVKNAGGKLLRIQPGTPLGAKLNLGLNYGCGKYCSKMDDDDWYAPEFLETMVAAIHSRIKETGVQHLAFLRPILFFDLKNWELRLSEEHRASGGTLLFSRSDWEKRPFRPLKRKVDIWFTLDQTNAGVLPHSLPGLEFFMQLRHSDHLTTHLNGLPFDEYLETRPLHHKNPESILPTWALEIYKEIRAYILKTVD